MTDMFEEAKAQLSIIDVFNYYGIKINSHNKAICPLHNEKTPSLKLYPTTNSFYCFGCGKGGSTIDFVVAYYSLEPLEAVRKLDNDFCLRLTDGEASEEQTLQIAEREKDKEITSAFNKWEHSYYNYVCENIHLLEALEVVSNPGTTGEFTDDFMSAINRKQLLEYHWSILFSGNLQDKISLYMDINKAVRDGEFRQQRHCG